MQPKYLSSDVKTIQQSIQEVFWLYTSLLTSSVFRSTPFYNGGFLHPQPVQNPQHVLDYLFHKLILQKSIFQLDKLGREWIWQQCWISVTSVSLNFRSSFLSSALSSAFTSTFPLWCSLSFTSSLSSVPLSLRFLAPLFQSHSAAARQDVSLVSGPSPISSDFLFLR